MTPADLCRHLLPQPVERLARCCGDAGKFAAGGSHHALKLTRESLGRRLVDCGLQRFGGAAAIRRVESDGGDGK
jgi:hypothetical protein